MDSNLYMYGVVRGKAGNSRDAMHTIDPRLPFPASSNKAVADRIHLPLPDKAIRHQIFSTAKGQQYCSDELWKVRGGEIQSASISDPPGTFFNPQSTQFFDLISSSLESSWRDKGSARDRHTDDL